MKNSNKKYAILFALTLLFVAGCETVVEFRGEYVEPQAVLNSVVTAAEPIRVYYAKSSFILANEPQTNFIGGATVELYINDEFVERLSPANYVNDWGERRDFYLSTIAPTQNDRVTIRARSEEFPEWVSATVEVPCDVMVGEFRIEESGIEGTSGYHYGTAILEISDPQESDNYYWLMGQTLCRNEPDDEFPVRGLGFDYTDVVFSEGSADSVLGEIIGSTMGRTAIFDDTLLAGEERYPLQMEWDVSDYYVSNGVLFQVQCYQMDRHLYKYLRSVELANDNAMFSEPVQIYSNVEGGIGIVGARSRITTLQKLYSEQGV